MYQPQLEQTTWGSLAALQLGHTLRDGASSRQADARRLRVFDFDVFLGGLRDQITYLGYDLNPDGVASLTEDAERLNASAESMFARIDDLATVLSEYSGALTAQ